MKQKIIIHSIIFFIILFFNYCTTHQGTIIETELKENKPNEKTNNTAAADTNLKIKEEKNKDNAENTKENKKIHISKAKLLFQELSKKGSVQYAPIDNQVISQDTSFKIKQDFYELNFATACLNDSLVAQEMSDFAQNKTFILAHNYETDISFKVNGRATSKKTIHKYLFKNKLEKEFLEKSIIKHPQFVKFDEAKNEAIFEFIIGVPNTDWLVIAAVNLTPQGSVRIIDIMMPDM
jgi:hypothetical protein